MILSKELSKEEEEEEEEEDVKPGAPDFESSVLTTKPRLPLCRSVAVLTAHEC